MTLHFLNKPTRLKKMV